MSPNFFIIEVQMQRKHVNSDYIKYDLRGTSKLPLPIREGVFEYSNANKQTELDATLLC